MNVKQCKQCGRLFQSLGADICQSCAEELDRCFITVKKYIYDHPDANVVEISEDTGIAEKMILRFLREGRLSLDTAVDILNCERCGAPITGGRFCGKCQSMLESLLGGACEPSSKKEEEKRNSTPSGRMHFNYRSE